MIDLKKIEELARQERLVSPTASTRDLVRNLKLWWCSKYNRPFKDPLLASYTIEELFYEYMTHHFLRPEYDPLKAKGSESSINEDLEWAKQQLLEMNKNEAPPDPPIMGENVIQPPEFTTKFE